MNSGRNIILQDLSIGYGKKDSTDVLLKDITASARESEMIAVIGANGIGKSPLLRTILGLQKPIEGKVLIEGKDIADYTHSELALIFGFVGTKNQVSQNLTVHELVGLGRFPHTNWIGKLSENDIEVISNAIRSVGLEKYENRKLQEMSDGERQRANIARVLAQDSKYLILDEPTAFLDLPNRYELVSLLRDIVDSKKKTVIYTTHDFQIAINESDKIWLLNKELLKEGAPEDLILGNDFSQQFRDSRLRFDSQSAEYVFPRFKEKRIGLSGESKYFDITQKALKRIKFEVGDNKDLFIRVSVSENLPLWELTLGETVYKFSSLYDLSTCLRMEVLNYSSDGDQQ